MDVAAVEPVPATADAAPPARSLVELGDSRGAPDLARQGSPPVYPGCVRGARTTTRRRSRPRRAAWAVLGVGVAALAVLAGSVGFVRGTARGHLFPEQEVPAAPVALVLGARVNPDGTPSPFLAARLDLAQRLYVTGKVKVILVSGDNMAPEYNEPDAMRAYLVRAGVPTDRVVSDYAGFDTYDSCARARRIFGVSDVIVVTQGYHLPRAVATCRRLGLSARGVGDETSRRYTRAWRTGAVRDQLACVKTVVDLAAHRDPILGRQETGVDRALAG
jgi:vancomycin permeability regulator SanA